MYFKTFSTIFLIGIVSTEHLRYELKSESNSESETTVGILKKLSAETDGVIVRIEDVLKTLSREKLIIEVENILIEFLIAINIAVHQQQELESLLYPATIQINDVLSELLSLSSDVETADHFIEPLLVSLKSLSTILKGLAENDVGVIKGEIFGSNKLHIKRNE
jgi:hypothetical protein